MVNNNLETSFQDGVSALYDTCVSCGVTPSDKSPTAIANAIRTISTNRYNAGRTQGQNDVKGNPNSYGLYTSAQYTANYNAGYSAGQSVTKSVRCYTTLGDINTSGDKCITVFVNTTAVGSINIVKTNPYGFGSFDKTINV